MERIKAGTIISDKYRFIEKIAETSTSVVWKAENIKLKKVVAIKMLDSRKTSGQNQNDLQNEAILTAQLKHPNIIEVYDFDRLDQDDIFIMEYLKGISLEELIVCLKNQGKSIPINDALNIITGVARALKYAHTPTPDKNEILHRDLKPANIYITENGEIKLLDLGIAKDVSPHSKNATVRNGYTPSYTDPSLWRDGTYKCNEYTKVNEIFCLGLVFYEMLTGETPIKPQASLLIGQYKLNLKVDALPSSIRNLIIDWLEKSKLVSAEQILEKTNHLGQSDSDSIIKLISDINSDTPYHISQTVINYRQTEYLQSPKREINTLMFPEIELIRPLSLKLLAGAGENCDIDLQKHIITFPFPSPEEIKEAYSTRNYEDIEEKHHILFRLLFYIQLTNKNSSYRLFDSNNHRLLNNLHKHLKHRLDSRHIAYTIAYSTDSDLTTLRNWLKINSDAIPYKKALSSVDSFIEVTLADYISITDKKQIAAPLASFIKGQLNAVNRHIPYEEIVEKAMLKLLDQLASSNMSLKKSTFEKILSELFNFKNTRTNTNSAKLFNDFFSREEWSISEKFHDAIEKTLYKKLGNTPQWEKLGIFNTEAKKGYLEFFEVDLFAKTIEQLLAASMVEDDNTNKKINNRLNALKIFSKNIQKIKIFHNDISSLSLLNTNEYTEVTPADIEHTLVISYFDDFTLFTHLGLPEDRRENIKTYTSLFINDEYTVPDLTDTEITQQAVDFLKKRRTYVVREAPSWERHFPIFLHKKFKLEISKNQKLPELWGNEETTVDDILKKEYYPGHLSPNKQMAKFDQNMGTGPFKDMPQIPKSKINKTIAELKKKSIDF